MPAVEVSEVLHHGDDIRLRGTLEGSGSLSGATFVALCATAENPGLRIIEPTVTISDEAAREVLIEIPAEDSNLLRQNTNLGVDEVVEHVIEIRMLHGGRYTRYGPIKFQLQRSLVANDSDGSTPG